MRRITISLGTVAALLVLTTAGPCLACPLPDRTPPAKGSCCHHGSCEKPTKAPASQGCAAPDLMIATIEKSATHIAPDIAHVVMPFVISHSAPLPAHRATPLSTVEMYSPPDLCLLNSVFNV